MYIPTNITDIFLCEAGLTSCCMIPGTIGANICGSDPSFICYTTFIISFIVGCLMLVISQCGKNQGTKFFLDLSCVSGVSGMVIT